MNITFLIGNLTKDPQNVEVEGKTLCKINIAVKDNYTKDGERPAQFFNVTVWNKLADNCLKYLTKGSKIGVVGKMQNRTWEDEKGTKHYAQEIVATEIEFLTTPGGAPKNTTETDPEESLPF